MGLFDKAKNLVGGGMDALFPGLNLGSTVLGAMAGPVAQPMVLPEPPPKPATFDTAALVAQEKSDMLRRRRGRTANIFTGELGAPLPTSATKSLLGE